MTGRDDDINGDTSPRRAIVAGFGPVGRVVANGLERAGFDVTIIEMNPRTADRQIEMGRAVVLGDVADARTQQEAGINDAVALILTIPDEAKVLEACRVARGLSPDIFIAARTKHLSKGMLATQAGADHATIEEVVTAEAMQQATLRSLGVEVDAGSLADPTR